MHILGHQLRNGQFRGGAINKMSMIRCLLAGWLGSALLPVAAGAHSPAPAKSMPASTTPTDNASTGSPPAIIITGTHISTPDAIGLEPVQSVGRAYLQARNLTNIADALNETPGFRGSETPDGWQGSYGQGVNFVNAFRLGSSRTLVLVNGRRVVSPNVPTIFNNAAPGNQVDLNLIPAILVDRMERVAVGGAPAYGSDAIAGTLNILLRDDITGPELSATTGLAGAGDHWRRNLAGAYGADFADGRGHITMGFSHDAVTGVRQNARAFYRANVADVPNIGMPGTNSATDGRLNPTIPYDTGPADGIPGTVLVRDMAIPLLSEGGLIYGGALSQQVHFNTQGQLVPFNAGTAFGPFASGGDGMRLNDYGQITSDLRRSSAHLMARYDLAPNMRLSAEFHHARSRAHQLVDQPHFNALLFSGVSGPLIFPATNPFLTDQARGLLLSHGYGAFMLSRAHADLGNRGGYALTRQTRGVIALDGIFKLGERSFRFDLGATYGQSRVNDHHQQINEQAFINAINVHRDASGTITCDAAPMLPVGGMPVFDPACVPLNLFGDGAPSAAAKRYVLTNVAARSRLEQRHFSARLAGSPFALRGHDVQISAGVEHRVEKAHFAPDMFQQLGLGRSVATPPVTGRISWQEAHGEILLPLITPDDGAMVHRFDIFGRARYSHASRAGSFLSWSAGARFQPVSPLTMRGNYTRSFRTPSIRETFSPLTPSRLSVPDLCSSANRNAGPAPDIRARNCAAFLASFPGATPLDAALITIPGLTGGNRDLTNERADSFTFGFTLQPALIPGLSLSADYVHIRVRQPIAYLSIAEIASACFDNADFNLNNPAHGNAYCSMIGRDATGQVLADPLSPAVRTGFVNGKHLGFSGIQASIEHTIPMQRNATMSLAADIFHVRRRTQDLTGVNRLRLDGLIGDPRLQAQLRMEYARGRWAAGLHALYTGGQKFARDAAQATPNDLHEISRLKAFTTFNAHLQADLAAALPNMPAPRINLAITNIFNRQGQHYYGAIIPASINDPLGRRFSLSVAMQF